MPAAEHQIGVVKRPEFVRFLQQRLDDRAARVVDQNKNVRQLDGRAAADPKPRRNARNDRPLGRADQRRRASVVIVAFEVERQHKPAARVAGGSSTNEHKPLGQRLQHAAVEIIAHLPPDAGNAFGLVRFAEERLGQDQIERGGRVADECAGALPVFGLRGVLVARNDCPFRKIRSRRGKHHIRHQNADAVFKHSRSSDSVFRGEAPRLFFIIRKKPDVCKSFRILASAFLLLL